MNDNEGLFFAYAPGTVWQTIGLECEEDIRDAISYLVVKDEGFFACRHTDGRLKISFTTNFIGIEDVKSHLGY